ncbi:SPFH/Band 7/PHB domain protein, partial [Helicobacter pylori]
ACLGSKKSSTLWCAMWCALSWGATRLKIYPLSAMKSPL